MEVLSVLLAQISHVACCSSKVTGVDVDCTSFDPESWRICLMSGIVGVGLDVTLT